MSMTSVDGSIPSTVAVVGSRAALSVKIPPPQPMSRLRSLRSGSERVVRGWRQELMKSWRRGFMRWRMREEPCGSHHEDARAEKWDSSVAETEDLEVVVEVYLGW